MDINIGHTSSCMILFAILTMQQANRRKFLQRKFKRIRMRMRKMYQNRIKLIMQQWNQMKDPIQLMLILNMKYQRIWQKIRSNDFWQRIVREHFTEMDWISTFRMSKDNFILLCNILRTELEPKPLFLKSREPLSVEKQVATALYKLSCCAEYRVIGDVMGIHKSTVRKCLFRVTKAINKLMTSDYIFLPSEEDAKFISLQFEKKSFIPQLLGSIDGTHIPITAPQDGYRDFVNRKGWTSYNMLAIVDHNGR